VVTRGDPPLTLDLPGPKESTVEVGSDIDPPEWSMGQIGNGTPFPIPGTVNVFLDTNSAQTRCWAGWWVAQLLRVASPRFLAKGWPDPGYRFFRVELSWPEGASVVVQHPADVPTTFTYVEAYGPTCIAELDTSDLEALVT
jgi:hypothetical protein